MNLNYRRALTGGGSGRRFNQERRYHHNNNNSTNNPNWPLESVNIKTDNFTRELDFTLSLGRRCRGSIEVFKLLIESGAVTEDNFNESVEQIGVNNYNVENGQIVVHCKTVEAVDKLVTALNAMESDEIRNCHSYKSYETPVTFAYVHPKADIQKDIIEKILNKSGKVLHFHAQIHPTLKIKTGAYIFIMLTKDLDEKPLPLRANINGFSSSISYSGRQDFCFGCGNKGHIKKNCPNPAAPPSCWHCQKPGHVQANCPDLADESSTGAVQTSEHSDMPLLEEEGIEKKNQFPTPAESNPQSDGDNSGVFLARVRPENDPNRPKAPAPTTGALPVGVSSSPPDEDMEVAHGNELAIFDDLMLNTLLERFPGASHKEKVEALKVAVTRIPYEKRPKHKLKRKSRGASPCNSDSETSESISKKLSKEGVVTPSKNIVNTQVINSVIGSLDLVSQAAQLSQISDDNSSKTDWFKDPEG